MKRFVIVLSLTIALLMASIFVASADCVPAAGTAGDDIIICAGTSGSVDGLAGNDTISITGMLAGGVVGGANDDMITVDGTITGNLFGDITGTDETGNDIIIINGTLDGFLIGDSGLSQTSAGDDVIIINGTVRRSIVGDSFISAVGGNDTIILRDGARVDNITISGGIGYDTLVFQLTVNSEADDLALSAQIAAANPNSGGTIFFQGRTFNWVLFDEIVNDLIRNYSTNVPIVVTLDVFQPLRDGRINGADHAAPVAVYPVDYGSGQIGLHVYDTATGVLLLEVTPELIAATDGVSEHTLIAEGAGVVVYRLADGAFYVGAPMANGKQYILTFDQLSATTAYSSTEVE